MKHGGNSGHICLREFEPFFSPGKGKKSDSDTKQELCRRKFGLIKSRVHIVPSYLSI